MDPNQGVPVYDENILAANAEVLDAYGRVFSKKIFKIRRLDADANYKDDVTARRNTLMRPLQLFTTESIRITDIKLMAMPDGTYQVRLNGQPSLQFPLTKPRILQSTADTVQQAIMDLDDPTKEPTYFINLTTLNRELRLLNQNTIAFARTYSERLMRIGDSAEAQIKIDASAAETYAKEIEKVMPSIERINMDVVEVHIERTAV